MITPQPNLAKRTGPSISPEPVSSIWLRDQARFVTSGNGEDGILEAIFDCIGAENKWCCEFGAVNGISSSITYNLIHNHGWKGVLIEGDPNHFKRLQENVSAIGDVIPIRAYVAIEGPNSLDLLLSRTGAPEDLDLLSIDIDNDDYHVWNAVSRFLPRVVVIEVNSQYNVAVDKVATPGYHRFTYFTGSSIKSMVELFKAKGYELAIHTGNAIFVRRDLAPLLHIDPENWQELFDPRFLHQPAGRQIVRATGDMVRMVLGTHYTTLGKMKRRIFGTLHTPN